MNTFFKKARLISWFGGRLVGRYWRSFISSFIAGLLLILLSVRLYPAFAAFTFRQEKIIGVVGAYTPTTLPLPIQNLISVGLTGVALTGEPVLGLSESWEAIDSGKQYIFHLKENIVWHDGKELTAYDINYNLRDVTITPLDKKTIAVALKESFSPLPILLSKPLFRKGLIGVGSYKLVGIRLKGDKITFLKLVPFQASSDLEPITIKFYPSEEAAKIGFILGEVNTLDEISSSDQFLTWQNISIKENVRYNRYVGLFFNMNDSLMKEKNLRQALAYALLKPEENPILTPLSSKSWAYNNNVKQYTADLKIAEKFLSKALDSTESAEITLSTFHEYLDLAQEIANSWEKLNNVSIKIKIENRLPQEYQVLLASQEIPPDPDQYPFWHSTQSQTNITHFSNAKIDKLLEDGRKELDPEKRKLIYYDFQRNLVDELPALFLFHPIVYTVSRE